MIEYPNRFEMMRALVKPGSTVCEIGVFTGQFANQLLALHLKRLVLIDPFQGQVSSGDADGNNVQEAFLPAVYVQFAQQVGRKPELVLLRGFSHELLPLFPAASFDAIYIDGDHSYDGVKTDLVIANHLVKPGGFICGHDYEMNPAKTKNKYNFGVKQAVDEFCAKHGYRIHAKALDGQVSFAIKKESDMTIKSYVDDSGSKFFRLAKS